MSGGGGVWRMDLLFEADDEVEGDVIGNGGEAIGPWRFPSSTGRAD